MRKTLTFLLAGGLLCGAAVVRSSAETDRWTGASAFDLDGEAADADKIVTSVAFADSTSYTVAAQPDTNRLIDMTVVDLDSSIVSGIVTITGTDAQGATVTCTFDFSVVATRGSGIKTLTGNGIAGGGCYLTSVTTVANGVLAIEGGPGVDTFTVGYTTASAIGWGSYGRLLPKGENGEIRVDPMGFLDDNLKVTTAGVYSTTVTSVASNAAFTNVVVGDLLYFVTPGGDIYVRRVTARASADSITVNSAVKLRAVGVPFYYKHFYFSENSRDRIGVFSVDGATAVDVTWSVGANANTGGVYMKLECSAVDAPDATSWVVIPDHTSCTASGCLTASGATQVPITEAINLERAAFKSCRVGWYFGTADDADAAAEDLNYSVDLRK